MFQTFVCDKRIYKKKNIVTFLKLLLNAMIGNIKIQNILNITKVLNFIQLDKFTTKKDFNENPYLKFSLIFVNFDGSNKMKV
jgi:hypothetical protein